MADTDFTSVYRQFFEEFARTVKPEDPLPIGVPAYKLVGDEVTGEIIELCTQYLTLKKCPQCLHVPIIKIALDEIQKELKKHPKNVYDPLKVMQMTTSKINEICLRYTDNEKLSSLPPPVKEPKISHHGIKNTRKRMEDRLICLPQFHALYNIPCSSEASYYGLFDGHISAAASSFAVSHLHQYLAESSFYPSDPIMAFREAYQKTETHFLAKELDGGSTALAVLHQIEEKKLIVSWLGDSQAILVRQEGYLLLTDPHKPDRKDECERIEKLGGFVVNTSGSYRVNGQLSVSRAIGDMKCKPYIGSEPDVQAINLTGTEEFIVIGCDGLWDVVEPVEVIECVYTHVKDNAGNIERVSERLINLAKTNRSFDNISVIVVFFADPVDICKRSVEAIGARPKSTFQGEMETNFQTATEKSPFVALSDQGMNRIYEENGTHLSCMDRLKEDSDDDLGPETDIDAVDDVLVSPTKGMNPFASDVWKKGGGDCDPTHDLIDYAKTENVDKAVVNFSENIHDFLKDNNVEDHSVREPLDNLHMNQLNKSYPMDSPEITFSEYNTIKNEFIEDIKVEKVSETSDNAVDYKGNSFMLDNEKEFVQENNFTEYESVQNNVADDFAPFDQKVVDNIKHEPDNDDDDLVIGEQQQIVCNGNAENYSGDKYDLEKPVSLPDEQPVLDVEDRLSNIGDTSETAELHSPSLTTPDDKLKDDIVAESGGEVDSEDDEWNYIKGDSGPPPPADEQQFDLAAISQQVADTEVPTMNTQLNPDAAEFYPVSPVQNVLDVEPQNPALRNISSSSNDILASTPKWDNMDDVALPDEISFMKEIRRRPSNLFDDKPQTLIDPEDLGCTNLDHSGAMTNFFGESEKLIPEVEEVSSSSAHGIALAPDMTSSFIDTSTMSVEPVISKDTIEQNLQELEAPQPEKHSTLNVDAVEFKSEFAHNVVPDLLSPQLDSVGDKAASPVPVFEQRDFETSANEAKIPEVVDLSPSSVSVEDAVKSPVADLSPLKAEDILVFESKPDVVEVSKPVETPDPVKTEVPKVDIVPEVADPVLLETNTVEVVKPEEAPIEVMKSEPDKTETVKAEAVCKPEEDKIEVSTPEKVKVEVATPEEVKVEVATPEEVKVEVATPDKEIKTEDVATEPAKKESTDNEKDKVEPIVEDVKVETVAAATAAAVGAVAAAAATVAVAQKKEEPKKATPTAPKPTATSKVTKTSATPRTSTTPTAKRATPVASKPASTKPVNTAPSPTSVKSTVSKVSSTTRTVTAKPAPASTAATSRPLVRKTTTTTTSAAPKPAPAKPLVSKTSTSPVKTTTATAASSTKAAVSSVAAPKPKPRVPSSLVLAKKPGVTSTSTVTATTKTTTTARPASAPVKSTVKSTVTTTRTTTLSSAKPRTGVTTTTTTSTTRTVLNSKKPLSVTAKTTIGSKPLAKTTTTTTTVSKVNGLSNGNIKTKTTTTKIENKTDLKADVEKSVDVINKDIENPVIENLVNGKDHD